MSMTQDDVMRLEGWELEAAVAAIRWKSARDENAIAWTQTVTTDELRAKIEELAGALKDLIRLSYSGDDVRTLAVAFAGCKVTPDIHDRCDKINDALAKARTIIRSLEGKARD